MTGGSTSSLCVRHTEESPLKWIPLGPKLCVRNMEVCVIQGLLYTSGRCVLRLLGMKRQHFQTSPWPYDVEKG